MWERQGCLLRFPDGGDRGTAARGTGERCTVNYNLEVNPNKIPHFFFFFQIKDSKKMAFKLIFWIVDQWKVGLPTIR